MVEELSIKFKEEQKRNVYITPKSFLDALELFKNQSLLKQEQLRRNHDRLKNGIDKLEQTNLQIKDLKVTLEELVPKLLESNQNAEKQVVIVEEQTAAAQKKEAEVEYEARIVNRDARFIEKSKKEAEEKVRAAQPALIAAEKAVNELNRDDITELKMTKSPNSAVKLALECTMVYLGYSGKTDFTWPKTQQVLAKMTFLDQLRQYNKDDIAPKIFLKVRALTSKPEFDVAKMTQVSKAAGGLAKWCKSIKEYAEALSELKPLREKQEKMMQKFTESQAAIV
jgi:dynein heavy chain